MENNTAAPAPEQFPMKWHNFLIYFSLWLSMAISLGYGVYVGFGLHYGGSAQMVYAYSGLLRVVDILYLVGSVAVAVYTFKTRQKLARFEKDAATWLIRLYFLTLILEAVYGVLVCMVVPELMDFGDMLSSLLQPAVSAVVMAGVNKTYYTKRAALFEN